jgi:hypothetical protein
VADLAPGSFLLKRQRRRLRRDLIHFFDTLGLFLAVGYDVSFGWPKALDAAKEMIGSDLREILKMPAEGGLTEHILTLADTYPDESHRVWFGVISELYTSGAGLSEPILAVTRALRREQLRELEAHARHMPLKANLLLILFFLPPSMVLLFAPLLLEVISGFLP